MTENCKQLLKEIIAVKKQLQSTDYLKTPKQVLDIEQRLDDLLEKSIPIKHEKLMKLKNRLLKHREYITTCLYYAEVPPDNNGSERALRNAKIKLKISGHFRTANGLNIYTTIRSVIDTFIKQKLNIFEYMNFNFAAQ